MIQSGRDIKVLSGVMDRDTESRYVANENYRYLLNARNAINQEGSFGAIEDVLGNVFIPNGGLFPGPSRKKCIGAFEDVAGKSCIFFIYDNQGYHGIYRYYGYDANFANGYITIILNINDPSLYNQWNPNPLNFQENSLITGVNLVDDILCYTDNFNSPRLLYTNRYIRDNGRVITPQIFRLYINNNLFRTIIAGPVTTTIQLLEGGAPNVIASITFTAPVPPDRATAINSLYNQLIADLNWTNNCTITNKVDYIEIEVNGGTINDPCAIIWTNNATPATQYPGTVVPVNFYPDSRVGALSQSYQPLNYQYIERVKYPAFCAPKARYLPSSNNLGSFRISLLPIKIGFDAPPNLQDAYAHIGCGDNSTPPYFDNTGLTSLEPSSAVASYAVPYIIYPGYITNNTGGIITISFQLEFTILYQSLFVATPPSIGVYIGPGTNNSNQPPTGPAVWNFDPATMPWSALQPNVLNVNETGSFQLANGETASVWVRQLLCARCNLSSIALSATVSLAGPSSYLSKKSYQFRTKYIYQNEQNSVYSAISTLPLPLNDSENKIEVTFQDKRLADVNFASQIKEVVLSVSNDNSLTWYDFKRLPASEWIGNTNQQYIYTGTEVMIPVDPAEAILPYHNVPLLSKSQEYVDDRIFDGCIVTGYDPVDARMKFNVRLIDLYTTDPYQTQLFIFGYPSFAFWRRGWTGYIGIVYYDDADRKSPVILDTANSKVTIPYYSNQAPYDNYDAAFIDFEIYHPPPDWATKYQLVRTKDLSVRRYLMWIIDRVEYVDENDNPGTDYVKIYLDNIPYYQDKSNKGAKISYTFVEGDRLRSIESGTFTTPNDYAILSSVANVIYIKNDAAFTFSAGDLIEIFTPGGEEEALLFYEFGECHEIIVENQVGVDKKVHKRGNGPFASTQIFGNLSSNIATTPATGDMMTGDVFYRIRQMPYSTNNLPNVLFKTFLISSQSPNEYTDIIFNNNGRINSPDLKGQTYQPSAIIFSDKYISNTQINGLGAVQPLNTEQYDTIYGRVERMVVIDNDILRLIFSNSFQLSLYVSQGVIRQTGGATNLISISNQVVSNSHLIQRTIGTINAESVALNDEADLFGYDENEGVVWATMGNALQQISDRGMKSVFRDYSNARKAVGGISEAPAIYDLYHDEYIITLGTIGPTGVVPPVTVVSAFPPLQVPTNQLIIKFEGTGQVFYSGNISPVFNIYQFIYNILFSFGYAGAPSPNDLYLVAPTYQGYENEFLLVTLNGIDYRFQFKGGQPGRIFEGVTNAYNKQKKGWTSYYSLLPEMYGRVRDIIVSFKDGQLYVHDRNPVSKNFYGVQYPRQLTYLSNKDFPKVKDYKAISVNGIGLNSAPEIRVMPFQGYAQGMLSSLSQRMFETLEGIQYAHFQKDRLTPGFGGNQLQALANGRNLKGQVLEVTLENTDTAQSSIFSTDIIYFYSEHS